MNIERFQYLAEAFGGDLSRWPADQQNAAAALLRTSPAARRALDEALALDALLNKATRDDDPGRVDRMAAAIAAKLSDRPAPGPAPVAALKIPAPRWAAGFLCAMALAGVLTGAQTGTTVRPPAQTAAVSLADLAGVSSYSSTRLLTAWAQ